MNKLMYVWFSVYQVSLWLAVVTMCGRNLCLSGQVFHPEEVNSSWPLKQLNGSVVTRVECFWVLLETCSRLLDADTFVTENKETKGSDGKFDFISSDTVTISKLIRSSWRRPSLYITLLFYSTLYISASGS